MLSYKRRLDTKLDSSEFFSKVYVSLNSNFIYALNSNANIYVWKVRLEKEEFFFYWVRDSDYCLSISNRRKVIERKKKVGLIFSKTA